MTVFKIFLLAIICYNSLVVGSANQRGLDVVCPPRHILACVPENQLYQRSTSMSVRDNVQFEGLHRRYCGPTPRKVPPEYKKKCQLLKSILTCEEYALRACPDSPEDVSEWFSGHLDHYLADLKVGLAIKNCRQNFLWFGCTTYVPPPAPPPPPPPPPIPEYCEELKERCRISMMRSPGSRYLGLFCLSALGHECYPP